MDAAGRAGSRARPPAPPERGRAASRSTTTTEATRAHPIAVVDDDESVRRSLERLLAAGGMSSVTFASAEEYLAAEPAVRFRCLLLDVHLRGISGPELAAGLAARGATVPIIFLTGSDEEPASAAVAAGHAAAVLRKPVDAVALGAAIALATPRVPQR